MPSQLANCGLGDSEPSLIKQYSQGTKTLRLNLIRRPLKRLKVFINY